MSRKCKGCNLCDVIYNGICGLCKHHNNDKSYDICELCDSIGNCNLEIDSKKFDVLLNFLGLQQVKENLRVAIRCESEESLKKLLIETLELLEGKENEC